MKILSGYKKPVYGSYCFLVTFIYLTRIVERNNDKGLRVKSKIWNINQKFVLRNTVERQEIRHFQKKL